MTVWRTSPPPFLLPIFIINRRCWRRILQRDWGYIDPLYLLAAGTGAYHYLCRYCCAKWHCWFATPRVGTAEPAEIIQGGRMTNILDIEGLTKNLVPFKRLTMFHSAWNRENCWHWLAQTGLAKAPVSICLWDRLNQLQERSCWMVKTLPAGQRGLSGAWVLAGPSR